MTTATAQQLQAQRNLKFAKTGLGFALGSGITWGLGGVILGIALGFDTFAKPELWLLAPLTAAAMHDGFAAIWLLLFNFFTGRLADIPRSFMSKPGRFLCLGALFGGPVGMGSYLLALKFAGAAYVMPITALYPAVASALAMVFLKEKIVRRAWFGLALCIIGGVIIGYAPPEGNLGNDFYIGIALAVVAMLGWGCEGVLATFGMDLLDPAIALNIRQLVSSAVYLIIILPLAGGFAVLIDSLPTIGLPVIVGAAFLGASSYLMWYRSMNMTGVSRAMAINITYSLWGILFSALFTDVDITMNIIVGALTITLGMVLVVGNPKEMVNLRNVD